MVSEKRLGKIERMHFGFGGYQDAMFGLSLTFSMDGYGVQDFIGGGWIEENSKGDPELIQSRRDAMANMSERIIGIMKEAKIGGIDALVGMPVEIITDNGALRSWRILTEVL